MDAVQPPEFIKLLANELRWSLLKTLTISDFRVHELVAQLQQPMNLVSYHLKKMREDALVTARRSEADGRDIYYSLNLPRLRQMYLEAGTALHPALGPNLPAVDTSRLLPQRVLFVCTHNSARSQMAEGLLRHLSQGVLHVNSAGSQPTQVHPDAILAMDTLGLNIRHHRSRSLDDVKDRTFDYVITVCDKAREVCPTFLGSGTTMHWGLPDPVVIEDAAEREATFLRTARQLKARIEYFLWTLPAETRESDY